MVNISHRSTVHFKARILGVLTLATLAFVASALIASPGSAVTGTSHITGHVSDAVTALPISQGNVYVHAYIKNGSDWDWMGSSAVDEFGDYDIADLLPGSYALEFREYSGLYVDQWYAGKELRELADLVVVGTDTVTPGINVALAPAAHITGQLTDAKTGAPITSGDSVWANVGAYRWSGSAWVRENIESVDSSGKYDVGGLRAGDYMVKFFDDLGDYVPQYYKGRADSSRVDTVSVAAGAVVPNIDAALTPASHIKGKLTDSATGKPLSNHIVTFKAYVKDGAAWTLAATDSEIPRPGYSIGGLVAGTYHVNFVPTSGYQSQYYRGTKSAAYATDIVVNEATVTAGINLALVPNPKPKVTITSNITTVAYKHAVAFSGTISSSQPKGTRVMVYARKPSSSAWVKLSTRYTTSTHRWSYTYSPATRGTWYFQARFPGTDKYNASSSTSRKITVR